MERVLAFLQGGAEAARSIERIPPMKRRIAAPQILDRPSHVMAQGVVLDQSSYTAFDKSSTGLP